MNTSAFWHYLITQRQNKKLPHALIISGKAASGLAAPIASYLFCQAPFEEGQAGGRACGSCKACRLMQSEARHPDLFDIQPEGKLSVIKIDRIRAMLEFIQQTAQQGHIKLVMIHDADTLNISAANALLKSLEEPPAYTYFILLSSRPHLLLPTIKSRAQMIHLDGEDEISALSFEALLEGLLERQDPLELAEAHKKEDLNAILDAIFLLLDDVIKLKVSQQKAVSFHYPDFRFKLEAFAKEAKSAQLFAFLDKCYVWRRELQNKVSLNPELFLENILIDWYTAFHSGTKEYAND